MNIWSRIYIVKCYCAGKALALRLHKKFHANCNNSAICMQQWVYCAICLPLPPRHPICIANVTPARKSLKSFISASKTSKALMFLKMKYFRVLDLASWTSLMNRRQQAMRVPHKSQQSPQLLPPWASEADRARETLIA